MQQAYVFKFWIRMSFGHSTANNNIDNFKRRNGRYNVIVKSFKESIFFFFFFFFFLIKGANETVENEAKEQKGGFMC